MFLVKFQYCEESFLRHLHIAYLLHALLSLLLFFKELALTTHVTTVTLSSYILAYLLHCFSCNNFCTNSRLYGYVKLQRTYILIG